MTTNPDGTLPPALAAAKLREVGEDDAARELEERGGRGLGTFFKKEKPLPPYLIAAHHFGFIPAGANHDDRVQIVPAGTITPARELQNKRVDIRLSLLLVAKYPGDGAHQVLFQFNAQHQLASEVEALQFTMTMQARDGQQAAVIGWPIFLGLSAGPRRVAFECCTLNVNDERLLKVIDSDVFRQGLSLLTVAQPALKPLAEISSGLIKAFAERNRNITVQKFMRISKFLTCASCHRSRPRHAVGSLSDRFDRAAWAMATPWVLSSLLEPCPQSTT